MKHQANKAECGMKPIKETSVQDAFLVTLNELVAERAVVLANIEQSVKKILESMPLKDSRELEKELVATDRKLIAVGKRSPLTAEDQVLTQQLIEQAEKLRQEIEIADRTKGKHDILNHRVSEIKQVLKMQYTEYKGEVFRSLIEKANIKDKNTIRFIFKCGMEREYNAD